MKELLILRHAKSSWDDSSLGDHVRPLNARGERDAPRVGKLIGGQDLMPQTVITSDAVRAATTAEAVASAAGYPGAIVREPRLYLAGSDDIIRLLRELTDDTITRVMIVGHNPGLEQLVAQLTGERPDFPTAALAHVILPIERWHDLNANTPGSLAGLWRPKELP